jgi:exodeoxyribonuclease V gamma subunit
MPVSVAARYATGRHAGNLEVQALEDAAREWNDGFEKADDHHVLVWGEDAPFSVLLAEPDPTEQRWWPEDATRLGVLARRVWEPLLDHERTERS